MKSANYSGAPLAKATVQAITNVSERFSAGISAIQREKPGYAIIRHLSEQEEKSLTLDSNGFSRLKMPRWFGVVSGRKGAILALVLVSLSVTTAGSFQRRQTANSNRTLVCVVNGGDDASEMGMDPVVMVVNGKLQAPFAEYDEAAQKKFAQQYFQAGRKYRLTFGGGEAGTATVKESGMGCNSLHAKVAVETSARLGENVRALATNSETLGRKPSARRAPTDDERAQMMTLVKQVYRQHRTSAALLKLLTTTNLVATDIDGDGRFELAGSFVIETKSKLRRDLFIVAEPRDAGYKAALVNFQSYKLPPEQFNSAVDFVDQLDLDGDGVGEVFAVQGGFDAYGYLIYKKQRGVWRRVFSAMGDAC